MNNNQSWQVTFEDLPTTIDMLRALPQADLKEAHYAAALLIPSLCLWTTNQPVALEMVNFLKGPQPLSTYDIQFIKERLRNKEYIPFSYLGGTSPENGYEPSKPFTVTVSTVPTSFDEPGYARLYLKSSGADSVRPVQLRKKESTGEWFLWEQMLLSEIRQPVAENPWA